MLLNRRYAYLLHECDHFIISTICFSNVQKTYSGVLAGQVSAQEKDQALKKLKDALQKVKIDPNLLPGAPLLGTCYVMSVKEGLNSQSQQPQLS